MKDKYISIITVVWNARDEIKKTIDSIIPFLSTKVELIVVDGESTDGTVELLKSYAGNPFFRYVSEKDRGIYDAMNKGAKLAEGKWFVYINAGDKLIQLPHEFDDKHEMSCYAVKTEDGVVNPNYNWSLRLYNTLPHQGIFYRKTSFKGFDDTLKFFADYDYNLKLLAKNAYVCTYPDVVSFHSLLGVSNSTKAGKELKFVLRQNDSLPWYILSQIFFKYKGLKKRIQNIYDKVFSRYIQ